MLKKLSVAGSLILAVFAGKAAFAGNEILLRGRCHQGECSFTKVVSTQTIGKNDAGYMLLIKGRSAIVNLSAKDPDPEKVKPPKYFGLVKVSFAFCSNSKACNNFLFRWEILRTSAQHRRICFGLCGTFSC